MQKSMEYRSPNKKHKAVLRHIGEVQAGHGYYSLSVDGLSSSFASQIFGKLCLWSPDSRYLVVQEWKDTDESGAPKFCQLLIIDVLARRKCIIANVEGVKANILPESFIGDSLLYTVIYDGQFGMTKSFESQFKHLNGWQHIN